MEDYSLLGAAKLALRITSYAFDDEIMDLIAAAQEDMKTSGIAAAAVDACASHPLLRAALVVYCKAFFGLDNADSEKYAASYRSMVGKIVLLPEYQETVS